MSKKHTQGGWKAETTPSGIDIWGDDKCICIIDTSTEQEANAKLIAQSPVMYTFIVDYIDAMEDKGKLSIHETALLESAKQIVSQLS